MTTAMTLDATNFDALAIAPGAGSRARLMSTLVLPALVGAGLGCATALFDRSATDQGCVWRQEQTGRSYGPSSLSNELNSFTGKTWS